MALSSSIPSVLLPALPAALVTHEMHVLAHHKMRVGGSPEITKLYSKEQIDALKTEFDGVKLLGSGAAEEWFKGLEAKGNALSVDAARWEKWDYSGGLQRMRQSIVEAHKLPVIPRSISNSEALKARGHVNGINTEDGFAAANGTATTKADPVQPAYPFNRSKKRTKHEAMELMKRRREEIERRAALLVPPLIPSVLGHMRSFQAAVQLTTSLDDDTWAVLAEKFLEQREEAEQQERDRRERANAVLTASDYQSEDVTNGKTIKTQPTAKAGAPRDPREVPDDEWDDIQGPVRAKISAYADEIIRDKWDDGEKVNKKVCPTFAADVLLHVRKRFYAQTAKEQTAARKAGKPLPVDPPEGPWLQKLTLENMKWVFDVKVKPFTNKLRQELFLCHGCSNQKYFGLEGVIQHYAAKHSETLSLGNVVVFWRAEWPEVPPFMPDPKNPKVYTPKDQLAQSKPSITASNSARSGLPVKPIMHQLATQAQPVPNHGHQQAPTYPATSLAYGPPAGYQHSHPPPQTPHATYPQVPPSTQDAFARSYPAAEHGFPHNASGWAEFERENGLAAVRPSPPQQQDERPVFMAVIARQTFDSLSRVDKLSSAVRLCVIVHHIAKRWQTQYNEAAPLYVFEDGLSSNHPMEPLRRINGLRCKACAGSYSVDLQHTIYSITKLVKHFRQEHVQSGPQPLDWRTEMVSLPTLDILYDLPRLLAQDRDAYDSVKDALPWAFAEPPPTPTHDSQPPAAYHRQGTVFHQPANDFSGNHPHGQAQFEQDRRPAGFPQDPRGPPPHPPQNGQHILDALEAQLGHPQEMQPPPASRAQIRPPAYHPDDPARPGWGAPSPADYGAQRHHEALPSHPHHPQQALQYAYGGGPQAQQAPEGEYEVLEARDPETGALYHIRRRVQRDPYQHHDGRAQTRPPLEDYRRAGNIAPLARTEPEDYDPRFPAGSGPTRY